jgi:hypothetical protein
MDVKTLIRLADAAERAGTTLPDVLALCTRGDDLHLDIYVVPPPGGWLADEWLVERWLDDIDPSTDRPRQREQQLDTTRVTAPIKLPLDAFRPWKGTLRLGRVLLNADGPNPDGMEIERRADLVEPADITADLLEVSKHQWAGWIAQRSAEVVDADRRERLTRRVTAAVQAAADVEFIWKTEGAAAALSARIPVSRQSLSRWRVKAAKKGLPVPARRRTLGCSRADLWLPDVGLLAAWASLLEIEGVRGRRAGSSDTAAAQPDTVAAVSTRRGKRKKPSHEENLRRLADARKKRR